MTWTAIVLNKSDNKPAYFHLDGSHSSAEAFDQVVQENKDLFVVCLVPGANPVGFHYESIHVSDDSKEFLHVPFKRNIL